MDPQKISQIFKALSDETRAQIILELLDGEKCACDLLKNLHITQPTLSHHARVLCDSGLVESKRIGRWIHFALSQQGIAEAQQITTKLFKSSTKSPFSTIGCC